MGGQTNALADAANSSRELSIVWMAPRFCRRDAKVSAGCAARKTSGLRTHEHRLNDTAVHLTQNSRFEQTIRIIKGVRPDGRKYARCTLQARTHTGIRKIGLRHSHAPPRGAVVAQRSWRRGGFTPRRPGSAGPCTGISRRGRACRGCTASQPPPRRRCASAQGARARGPAPP